MKNPHVKPSFLIMTAFLFMISLGSSWSCNTKSDLPLFYGPWIRSTKSASDKILATLPEIVALGDKVSFPSTAPLLDALKEVFSFLKFDETRSLTDAKIESKRAEDAIKKLNAHAIQVQKSLSSMLDSKVSLDVKKKDWLTAVNACEKTFPLFYEKDTAFNEAMLASCPHYVAFATVYLTVAELGKAFNPEYIPKLIEEMKRLLDNLSEYEFGVKPQRKFLLQKKKNRMYDELTDSTFTDVSCHWTWRDDITKGIKKYFTPIKESVAAFAGVPVPVRYQYFTKWADECFYSCDFHGGTSYSWCWTLGDGLGKGWSYCSEKKDFTIYGKECRNHCKKAGWDYYWCYTTGYSWDYCSLVRVQ